MRPGATDAVAWSVSLSVNYDREFEVSLDCIDCLAEPIVRIMSPRTWRIRCQDDPTGSATRELEETTRASPYHVAEHHPVRSESLQPHTERSRRPGSEPPSVEADVYVWCCALLVVHVRKTEEEELVCDCVSSYKLVYSSSPADLLLASDLIAAHNA